MPKISAGISFVKHCGLLDAGPENKSKIDRKVCTWYLWVTNYD